MIVFIGNLERQANDTLDGIYDIEDYEGEYILPYKRIVNLNWNKTYRVDFLNKVMFWEKGELTDLPTEYR